MAGAAAAIAFAHATNVLHELAQLLGCAPAGCGSMAPSAAVLCCVVPVSGAPWGMVVVVVAMLLVLVLVPVSMVCRGCTAAAISSNTSSFSHPLHKCVHGCAQCIVGMAAVQLRN
jgi:hypothetical protein